VAAKQQGWIREKFDPFLRDLELKGFDFDPSVIVRTLAIVGHGSARLLEVPEWFWEQSDQFDEHWRRTKEAVSAVVRNLMDFGVLSSDLLPSLNVLIPVFVLKAFFPQDFNFRRAFCWMLTATRDGRYSGSAITVLDQDTRKMKTKQSFDEAITDLSAPIQAPRTFKKEDFREEYTDRFLRLILYLTAFNAQAKDWMNQDVRIGFDREDNEMNEGFKPEWHHVFPRKLLRGSFDDAAIDSLANIAVLNEKANRSFSSKPPSEYLQEYQVQPERLAEQAVPAGELLDLDRFEEFLDCRSSQLAERATAFLEGLNQ
jgi:hypothetical protein